MRLIWSAIFRIFDTAQACGLFTAWEGRPPPDQLPDFALVSGGHLAGQIREAPTSVRLVRRQRAHCIPTVLKALAGRTMIEY